MPTSTIVQLREKMSCMNSFRNKKLSLSPAHTSSTSILLTQSILHDILRPPENLAFSDLVNLGLSAKANGSMLTRN